MPTLLNVTKLLNLIPQNRRVKVVESMEELANLFEPGNEAFQNLLKVCHYGFFQQEIEK